MTTVIPRTAIGILIAAALTVTGACARHAPEPQATVPSAVTEWLSQDRRTIAVIALGPDQRMGHQWFEFDRDVRRWLTEAPTMTTRKRRPPLELRDAFADVTLNWMEQGAGAPVGALFLAPLWIPLGTLIVAATPQEEYETTRPLAEAKGVDATAVAVLDKRMVAEAVRDRIVRLAADATDHDVRRLPFDEIGDDTWSIDRIDTTLTVRIVRIGLWADRPGATAVALKVSVWSYFDRTTFLPAVYVSRARNLDAWSADGGRLLDDELDRAAQDLAEQIVANLFVSGEG